MIGWLVERVLMPGMVLFLVVFLLSIPFLAVESGKESDRLMKQCMDDGLKEYECRAMLRSGRRSTVAPIIFPKHR